MKIQIIPSLKDAHKTKGLAVVIDVLRAFTTICYVFANGAKEVIPTVDLNEAYAMKKNHPSYLLIGEKNGVKPSDFDWGNSPAQLKDISFKYKTIILTTSAGTKGIHKAMHAEKVITGAFVNASAIVRYIQVQKPQFVTLLCTNGLHPENEDIMCANYIKYLLQDRPVDFSSIKTYMKAHPSAKGFLHHPLTNWSKKDYTLCMTVDTFNFVVKVKKRDQIILENIWLK